MTVGKTQSPSKVEMVERGAGNTMDAQRWASRRCRVDATARSAQTWCRGKIIDCLLQYSYRTPFNRLEHYYYGVHRYRFFPRHYTVAAARCEVIEGCMPSVQVGV